MIKYLTTALLVSLSSLLTAEESVLSYRGDAFSLEARTSYTEYHELTTKDGRPVARETRYQTPNTEEFAQKTESIR